MSHQSDKQDLRIAVIGGGAAGFFGAIQAKETNPAATVILLEKTSKLLSKVRISGGGRCNVTHACFDTSELVKHYPRGEKELRSVFARFSPTDTIEWFRKKGVTLKTEADGRMFPITDNSETIAQALLQTAERKNIQVLTGKSVDSIAPQHEGGFLLKINGQEQFFHKVLVASGGGTKLQHFDWLATLGHEIVPPVPSLFTFNLVDRSLPALAGISVDQARVKVLGTKLEQQGPLLITHWGLSGPAILKLSAWGARALQEKDYRFTIAINWLPALDENEVREQLESLKQQHNKKLPGTLAQFAIPSRLWQWFIQHSGIAPDKKWADVSKKEMNRLVETLRNCTLEVNGKSTFKEEFVTAGGISLKDMDMKTMESRKCPGLYFAGEVLNIDGITGGFNFQSAWATGYIAGTAMAAQG